MRNVEVVLKDGKYGVIDDGIEAVPFQWSTPKEAIFEWEYFERLNTEEEPYRRFLKHVTPIEEINEIVSQY